MNKVKVRQTVVFGLLSLMIVGFIFYQSAQRADQSNEVSGEVTQWLSVIIGPLFDSDDMMHKFVRKAAHFIEFAALGGCIGLFTDGVTRRFWRSWAVFMPMFVILLTGVVDEFIQSFSDRTSMVKDVLLDFSGGLFGVLCAALLLHILSDLRKKKG